LIHDPDVARGVDRDIRRKLELTVAGAFFADGEEAKEEKEAKKELAEAQQGLRSNAACAAPGHLYPPRPDGQVVIAVSKSPSGGYCFEFSRPFNGLAICSHFNSVPKGFVVTAILGKAISGDIQFPYGACSEYASDNGTAWEIRRPTEGMVVCDPPSGPPPGFVITGKYEVAPACSVYPVGSGNFLAIQIKRPTDGLVMCGGWFTSPPAGYVIAAQTADAQCGVVFSNVGFNAVLLKAFPTSKKPTVATRSLVASRKGGVALTVTCPSNAGTCSGSLALEAQKPAATASLFRLADLARPSSGRHRPLNLGRSPFKIDGGEAEIVKLRLRPQARRLLARAGDLRARALLAVRDRHAATMRASAVVKIRKGYRSAHR